MPGVILLQAQAEVWKKFPLGPPELVKILLGPPKSAGVAVYSVQKLSMAFGF